MVPCFTWIIGAVLPDGSDSKKKKKKKSACNAEDPGSIPGLGRSHGERMTTHSNILAWKIIDRGACLVGYSPWGHKELDMTE